MARPYCQWACSETQAKTKREFTQAGRRATSAAPGQIILALSRSGRLAAASRTSQQPVAATFSNQLRRQGRPNVAAGCSASECSRLQLAATSGGGRRLPIGINTAGLSVATDAIRTLASAVPRSRPVQFIGLGRVRRSGNDPQQDPTDDFCLCAEKGPRSCVLRVPVLISLTYWRRILRVNFSHVRNQACRALKLGLNRSSLPFNHSKRLILNLSKSMVGSLPHCQMTSHTSVSRLFCRAPPRSSFFAFRGRRPLISAFRGRRRSRAQRAHGLKGRRPLAVLLPRTTRRRLAARRPGGQAGRA